MNPIKVKNTSRFSLIVIILIVGWFSLMPLTKSWNNVISWDIFGYYLYSPSLIIWNDIGLKDFSKVEKINEKYRNTSTYYQGMNTDRGTWMIKYTMGLAILESPFFLIAHSLAQKYGYETDGFSKPYELALIFFHFLHLCIGFIFLRKALLSFFSDGITAFLLCLIIFATNYYVTATMTIGSIHALEFTLFSIVLFLSILWHQTPTNLNSSLLGLTIGLIVLVRPTDGIIAIVPLLWNVTSLKTLKKKFTTILKSHKAHLALALGFCLVVIFPQLLYWKIVAGKWFLMSYNNNPGEGFEFLSPYTLDVLFSFRKGWFLYTPIMLFAVVGFWFLHKNNKSIFITIFTYFILNVYVVSSWSCWWYATCFGQRAMVESYSLLIIPLGFFITSILSSPIKKIKASIFCLIGLMVVLNIFQSWQYMNYILVGDRITSTFYFRIFGKTSTLRQEDRDLLLVNRFFDDGVEKFENESEYSKRILFFDDFEIINERIKNQYSSSLSHSGSTCLMLDSNYIFSKKNELGYTLITNNDHAWIRTSFWYYSNSVIEKNSISLVTTFVNQKNYLYKYAASDIVVSTQNKPAMGKWYKFTFDYLTPEVRDKNDKINIYLWLRGNQRIFIDDFEVLAFEKKIGL